jgi:hypothetical protein
MSESYTWTCGIRGCHWQGPHVHRDSGRAMGIEEVGSVALMAERESAGVCPHCGCDGAMAVSGPIGRGGAFAAVLRCHRCGMDRPLT